MSKQKSLADFFTPAAKKTCLSIDENHPSNELVQLQPTEKKETTVDTKNSNVDTTDDKKDTTNDKKDTTDEQPTTTRGDSNSEKVAADKTPSANVTTAEKPTTTPVSDVKVKSPSRLTYENLEEGLPQAWRNALAPEFKKPYWTDLKKKLIADQTAGKQIFPTTNEIFTAFQYLPSPDDVRVVLLGQDPYPTAGVAMGLSFSVHKTTPVPQSLRNMYKELITDIPGFVTPTHGDLSYWAKQGVFMINTVLTVLAGQANSHKDYGWQQFTDAVVALLARREKLVWLLWGRQAETKAKKVDKKKHRIIVGVHPSPLSASRGFFGSKPFSQINSHLKALKFHEIDWQVPK